MLKLEVTAQSFPIAGTFTISRGSKTTADVVHVRVSDGHFSGQGECVPYKRYGETVEQAVAALSAADAIANRQVLPKSAQNALDCALWDLEAKRSGTPAWKRAGLGQLSPRITAYTLSLDAPEAMAKAAAAAPYPLLKLKLGREGDAERLAAIRRAAPSARLIVDANEGWDTANIKSMLACCELHGVELVEQPLPAGEDEVLSAISSNVMICADESAHDTKSLEGLKGKYDAVNIKLDKTGGLTEALAMARRARELDFKVFVGCMLATSLAMAPAFLVAQLADYVDLDGPLLLAKDREPAIKYVQGLMHPPEPALWG